MEPSHNGVGGYGGCLVVYIAASRKVVAIDFNTTAPAAASADMFVLENTDSPAGYRVTGQTHIHGGLSVGVPGVVSGLCLALETFGTMPLAEVLEPAVHSARHGFVANAVTRERIAMYMKYWKKRFPETGRALLKGGRLPRSDERIIQHDLSRTLEEVAEGGAPAFYEGEIARKIVECVQSNGGLLTLEDLQNYSARLVVPDQIAYRGYTIHTPPLGAGGLTVLQMLRVIEEHDIVGLSPSARFHVLAEVMKIGWVERLSRFGDSRFVNIDSSRELGDGRISKLSARLKQALPTPQPGKIIAYEPLSCTSHISTADVRGNLVALTQTHGGAFGSMLTVPGTGLLLGHGVGRFDPRPGLPNSIAPGKQPIHNMAPIVLLQQEKPFASYGIPGGRTIPNNQLTISMNLMDLSMTPQQALNAPRIHSEGAEPIQLEERTEEAIGGELERLGHDVEIVTSIGGSGQCIVLSEDPAHQIGATDPRGEGGVSWA